MLMNFKMIAAMSAVTLLLSVVALPASASPLWDVDFDGYTIGGLVPQVLPTAGDVNTDPTNVFGDNGNTTLRVEDGFGALGGGGDLVAVILDGPTGTVGTGQIQFDGNDSDASSTGLYSFNYDILFTAASAGNVFTNVENTTGDNLVQLIHVLGDGRVALNFFDSGGGFLSTSFSAFGLLLPDVVNNVRLGFDLDANTVGVFLNGNSSAAVSGALGAGVVLDSFRITSTNSATQAFAVNNVTGTAIPEPSSIALVSLGLIGMIGLGARRRM